MLATPAAGDAETAQRRRRGGVSPECEALLALAAVIGVDFGLNVLERVSGYPRARLLTLLDEAILARTVEAGDGIARFRFSPAELRQRLYGSLSASRRATLHRAVGLAIEQIHAAYLEPQLAALAHHFLAAAADGDVTRGVAYALRAGDHAIAAGDRTQGLRHYQDALDALDSATPSDDADRCAVLLRLAEVYDDDAGRTESRSFALHALELARRIERPEPLARAALAYAGRPQPFSQVECDERVVAVLDEALVRLPPGDGALRARLLGRLAEELTFSERHEHMRRVADEALAIARRLPDRAVLADVLGATHWALWAPGKPADRVALANEIRAHNAASEGRLLRLEFDAHLFRMWALIELGDAPAARAEIAGCAALAERLNESYARWLIATTRVCLAFMGSELGSVPELAQQAYELSERAGNLNGALFYGVQMTYLQWLRGDLTDTETTLQTIGDKHPLLTMPVRAALADTYAELGRLVAARQEVDGIAAKGFDALPRNLTWISSMSFLAEACARLGDAARAAEIYPLLEPLADCNVLLVPVAPFGAASYFLGLLATTVGRYDDAERHYEHALRKNDWMGTRQILARTQTAYAAMLLERGGAGDRGRAIELLAAAERIAEELSLRIVVARIGELRAPRARAATAAAAAGPPSRDVLADSPAAALPGEAGVDDAGDPPEQGRFRREADYFEVEYAGRTLHLKDSKGLRYLALLLSFPDRDFAVMEMLRLIDGATTDDASLAEAFDAGLTSHRRHDGSSLEDRRSLEEYRRHWRDLSEQLADAERDHDLGRVAAIREQLEAFERLVRSATAPGGRSRRFTDEAERARQAVQKAIAGCIRRIRRGHPRLADHLETHVKTGSTCCYRRSGARAVVWQI